jgi:hypothetical protein
MKRYLTSQEQRINLHDLVSGETERVFAGITSARFTKLQSINADMVVQRLRAYEREAEVLVALFACGGYWASDTQAGILIRSLMRLSDDTIVGSSRFVGINLHRYPATLLLYAMGIADVAARNYRLLNDVLSLKVQPAPYSKEVFLTKFLAPISIFDKRHANELMPGRNLAFTPVNDYVFEVLREPLREYLPDDKAYEEAFNWFEYLLGLVHCDLTVTSERLERVKTGVQDGFIRGPYGRFIWDVRNPGSSILDRTEFKSDGPYPEAVAAALSGGMFGSQGRSLNYDRFLLIKRGFDLFIQILRGEMGVW